MPLTSSEQDQLCHGARRFAIELSHVQLDAFGRYLDLLQQWRSHARLISRRQTRADIIRKHLVDSFAVIPSLSGRRRIADVGSGAGLPGIPVAIVLADARITLIEANRRKANFLREVIRQLDLANAEVVEARLETLSTGAPAHDAVVCRAVWSLADLLGYARGLLAPGGVVIAMKGPAADEELATVDLPRLGFTLESLDRYTLDSAERRVLVRLRLRFT